MSCLVDQYDYRIETGMYVCVRCVRACVRACVLVCAHGHISILTKFFTKITPLPQKRLIYFTCLQVILFLVEESSIKPLLIRCTLNKNDEVQAYNVLITDDNYANER